MIKTWICPVCELPTTLPPALCRRDNKTKICSTCGTNQGLADIMDQLSGVSSDLEDAHTDLEIARKELAESIEHAGKAAKAIIEKRSNEHQYPDLGSGSMVDLLDPEGLLRKALVELTILKPDAADKLQEMVNENHAAENQSESDSYPE